LFIIKFDFYKNLYHCSNIAIIAYLLKFIILMLFILFILFFIYLFQKKQLTHHFQN